MSKKPRVKAMLQMETIVAVDGKVVSHTKSSFGVCQKCGCTDFDCAQCVAKTGQPCSWVDKNHTLRTACVPAAPKSPRAGLRIARGGA